MILFYSCFMLYSVSLVIFSQTQQLKQKENLLKSISICMCEEDGSSRNQRKKNENVKLHTILERV